MHKKGVSTIMFNIIELIFAAMLALAIFSYVQSAITDDAYWFKYYSKDLALTNNIILATPEFRSYYEFQPRHNYSIILEQGKVSVLNRDTEKMNAGNSHNSIFATDSRVKIIDKRMDASNFSIIKEKTFLKYEKDTVYNIELFRVGIDSNNVIFELLKQDMDSCDVEILDSSRYYDYIIKISDSGENNELIYYKDTHQPAIFNTFAYPNIFKIKESLTNSVNQLVLELGNNYDLNKVKEALVICK